MFGEVIWWVNWAIICGLSGIAIPSICEFLGCGKWYSKLFWYFLVNTVLISFIARARYF